MTKDELIAIAEADGVEIDKRWSKARIADAVGVKVDAAEPAEPGLPEGMAKIRVLPLGDGKIGTGEGFRKNKQGRLEKVLAKRGDHMVLDADIALGLEKRGFAEIV